MAKRKVIKFVYQGNRPAKPGEYHTAGNGEMWYDIRGTNTCFDVYHRIEIEEEVPRWRAEVGGQYRTVSMYYSIIINTEVGSALDDMLFDANNYFQTEEQAQEYLDHCKKFFENN
jgi:hypothetical protein